MLEEGTDYSSEVIKLSDGNMIEFYYLKEGVYSAGQGGIEQVRPGDEEYEVLKQEFTAERDLTEGEKEGNMQALAYLQDMLGNPSDPNLLPVVEIIAREERSDNASASSELVEGDKVTRLAAFYLNKGQKEYFEGTNIRKPDATITIDQATVDWYTEKMPTIPVNGLYSDYGGTVLHELVHAIGLAPDTESADENNKDSDIGTVTNVFAENIGYYTENLRDVFGTQAKAGMEIVKLAADECGLDESFYDKDKFYIEDNGSRYGGAYYTSDNVAEVLNGAKIAWPEGNLDAVEGLPINGYEPDGDGSYTADLAHIELKNGLMSHQSYRNWCTLMEAELAVLQDMGFKIDRKQFFGRSIYNSDGDFVNEAGFNSGQNNGVGLHIYGDRNTVLQKADLLAGGDYAIGMRVDGVANKLTLDKGVVVAANGTEGNGLAVVYGKDHEINVRGDIQALGKDGVAARFDFGSNELGDAIEYRGSYIRYELAEVNGSDSSDDEDDAEQDDDILDTEPDKWELLEPDENGTIATDMENREWQKMKLLDELDGALVNNFNVSGTLAGEKAAIFISKNAYVENINILNGARLQGDIISEWNPKGIIYENTYTDADGNEVVSSVAPDLSGADGLTNLTFGLAQDAKGNVVADKADADFKLYYDGNIKGKDSLVMTVAGGYLNFNGEADVYDTLTVEEGATLEGAGTYKIYAYDKDGKENVAGNGQFINYGTLAPGNGIGTITIDGDYVQTDTGKLLVEFDSENNDKLAVTEEAKIAGTIALKPLNAYVQGEKVIGIENIVEVDKGDLEIADALQSEIISPTLKVDGNADKGFVITRKNNAYTPYAVGETEQQIAQLLNHNSKNAVGDAQNVYAALDSSAADGSGITSALGQMNPTIYGSGALATMDAHNLLSGFAANGRYSSRSTAKDAAGWRNVAIPYGSYLDQHNSKGSYTNHHSGVLLAMERTLNNGLTMGYHGAINHQSTSDDKGSRLRGEGLYIGAQASYAPEKWQGWQAFGLARLGIEQQRLDRNVSFNGYEGKSDSDWHGYSGSLSIGGAHSKDYGAVQAGPFAALSYSFVHQPSVDETAAVGTAVSMGSETYDSLRTQLGYRIATEPKKLDSYDSTRWQAHASVAWNHELLDSAGTYSGSFVNLPGGGFSGDVDYYGRDSMSIMAGVTFQTPNKLDVTLSAGSDIYRKGGSAIYGKAKLEWKF